MVSNSSTILRVYGAMSVGIPPVRMSSAGRNGELLRDERYGLQRIVVPKRNDAFRRSRPLLFSISSDTGTGCELRQTLQRNFIGCGGPIIIEERLKIDLLASLFLLHPR